MKTFYLILACYFISACGVSREFANVSENSNVAHVISFDFKSGTIEGYDSTLQGKPNEAEFEITNRHGGSIREPQFLLTSLYAKKDLANRSERLADEFTIQLMADQDAPEVMKGRLIVWQPTAKAGWKSLTFVDDKNQETHLGFQTSLRENMVLRKAVPTSRISILANLKSANYLESERGWLLFERTDVSANDPTRLRALGRLPRGKDLFVRSVQNLFRDRNSGQSTLVSLDDEIYLRFNNDVSTIDLPGHAIDRKISHRDLAVGVSQRLSSSLNFRTHVYSRSEKNWVLSTESEFGDFVVEVPTSVHINTNLLGSVDVKLQLARLKPDNSIEFKSQSIGRTQQNEFHEYAFDIEKWIELFPSVTISSTPERRMTPDWRGLLFVTARIGDRYFILADLSAGLRKWESFPELLPF